MGDTIERQATAGPFRREDWLARSPPVIPRYTPSVTGEAKCLSRTGQSWGQQTAIVLRPLAFRPRPDIKCDLKIRSIRTKHLSYRVQNPYKR